MRAGALSANLLPREGEAFYHGAILSPELADRYLSQLRQTIAWRHDEIVLFGKRIVTARQVAWYGEADWAYTYSGMTKEALPWTVELEQLKSLAEQRSGQPFTSCLLNLYDDGEQGMGWHSDDEPEIVPRSTIASLSFGAVRRFRFQHKRDPALTAEVLLEHGSLLLMSGETQSNWRHCLPKMKRVREPRINLTFRQIRHRR